MNESELISEFKKRFKEDVTTELYEDDRFFYRFLKACSFNVDNAERMLRKHLEFREKYDIANILKYEQPEVAKKYMPFIRLGYDKEGSVVRYCPAGTIDWIGLTLSLKPEDITKRIILDIEEDVEEHKRQSEKLGRTIDKTIYIYNLDKLTFAQATNKRVVLTSLLLVDIYQNNYPERLKAIYVINATLYFSLLFSVMKSVLSGSILDKIKIYSDESYKEDLLKLVDEDVLPGFLGGSRTDPDGNPLCKSFISDGGHVPETDYIHKSKRSLASLPDAEKIVLTRATFHEIFNKVDIPGSYLEWEFETKTRDVGFGLFYQMDVEGEENAKEIVPLQRIDTEDYAEHGMYRCENPGTYVIVFDNTYSWIRAKEIYYRVKIVTPEEQKENLQR